MQVQPPDFMIFTGNANPVLASEIAQHLGTQLGNPVSRGPRAGGSAHPHPTRTSKDLLIVRPRRPGGGA